LYCSKALARAHVEVTLIDRRNFHLFQPLLYQVATGALSPGEIAAPLRHVLRRQANARVLLGEITGFDLDRRLVLHDGGEERYDTLVVALGMRSHYFGNEAWQAHAPALKSIEDATEMRSRIFHAFECAEREPDPALRREWLTFVVVGGGPTGVELAGTLGEIANDTLRGDFRRIRPEDSRIFLLDAAPRLLGTFPEPLSAAAELDLLRLGVRTLTGLKVVSIDERGVEHSSGRIAARTVLWAAGVVASPLGASLTFKVDRAGRVQVEPDLTLPGRPEVLVIGDLASLPDASGMPLPGVAPVAMQQGRYAARLIQARLEGRTMPPFRYFNKGNLATIGRWRAVADFGRLRFSGWFAWLIWLFVHLLYIVQFESRVLIAVRWAFEFFTYNRGARLITGRERS
jgi:NADH dehydrogenase